MAIGTLFPSGLGLEAGVVINSSKFSLVLILGLILILIYNRAQFSFHPNSTDKLVLNFVGWVMFGAAITGLVNLGGVGGVVSLETNALFWVLAYLSFYFVGRLLPRTFVEAQWIMKSLLVILIVCALIGIIEAIFRTNFYGELGRALGLRDAGSGTELWRGFLYRARSSLDQPIAFAFAMVCGYVLTDYLLKIGHLSNGAFWKSIFILTVFLSGTRSAILALLICIGVLNYYRKVGWLVRGLVLAGMAAGFFWMLGHIDEIFYVDESLLAGEETLVGQSGNLIGRFRDFIFVLNVLESNPIFGVGSGLLHNDAAFAAYYPILSADYDGALDNMVLAILVENGVVGFVMATVVVTGLFGYAYRLKAYPEKLFLDLMVFLFLSAALSYDLLVFPGTGRLMLLLIALGISAAQFRKSMERTGNV